ncbi:MAG: hypothetical protein HKO05_09835 [Erythrobacter sp.]|nr:hypothetical protein [Erythrobacter sp.]
MMTDHRNAFPDLRPVPNWMEVADFWFDFWLLGAASFDRFWQEILPTSHRHEWHGQLAIPEPIAREPEQDLLA